MTLGERTRAGSHPPPERPIRASDPREHCDQLGALRTLPVADHSVAGTLAWYSLIHVPRDDLDDPCGASLVAAYRGTGNDDGAQLGLCLTVHPERSALPSRRLTARIRARRAGNVQS